MKKIIWQVMLVVGLFVSGLAITASADNLNYTVKAELPSNQVNQDVSYFDLKVKPGQRQNLTVTITNNDKRDHQYTVSPNLAVTNDNGVIDYSQSKAKADSSLKFNVKSALSGKQTVTVAAKSSKRVTVKLTVPAKRFSGTALGGINVVQAKTSQRKKQSGMAIDNQYAYVLGVQLRENVTSKSKPRMKLHQIKAAQLNYRNYVTANLQNDQPAIMHNLKINSYITKRGGKKQLMVTKKDNLAMAPNSNFNFAMGDGEAPLKAGKYTLHLKAKADEGHWQFTRDFTISSKDADQLNETAVGDQAQPNYFWWFVALGVIIIALLAVVIWLVLKNKCRQDD
ncbi:DUF916 and DUF3324 domain-containing protein [Lactiplantibacillus plajomi]|uniref:DUF916 and DUF3324 domain-containing protein n=1 Tax=Lactiplantibacillus plajomi TaxID=1457217 RepID=A0ABV6K715_9LACO|nr:DUF916 and DUF3324 domain-containing protein [Lactiplantibacillus plajomi]